MTGDSSRRPAHAFSRRRPLGAAATTAWLAAPHRARADQGADQRAWAIGKAEGVFEKVDYANIPHIGEVYDLAKDPDGYAPFTNFGAWGIVHDRDTAKTPPASCVAPAKRAGRNGWLTRRNAEIRPLVHA